jgi:CRP/FNR family transcriptional regulator, anaerobic regulatory protein
MKRIPLYRVDTVHPQAQACAACSVRGVSLFGALDQSGLDYIHAHIASIELQPGKTLFESGALGHALYTLRDGIVRFERVTERGDRRIVRLAGRSTLIGQEALLGHTYAADAIACTPVRACRLPRELIDELGAQQPLLLCGLMQRWQTALDEADEWLTELNSGTARWRMLRLLLKLTEFGEPDGLLWLPTRQEMSAMLGMTVETSSRLVAALRRESVLELVDARHARIDMPALAAAIQLEAEPAA